MNTDIEKKHPADRVIIVRSANGRVVRQPLALVAQDGMVVAGTHNTCVGHAAYQGIGMESAVLAACSVMRNWNDAAGDNLYPEMIELEWDGNGRLTDATLTGLRELIERHTQGSEKTRNPGLEAKNPLGVQGKN